MFLWRHNFRQFYHSFNKFPSQKMTQNILAFYCNSSHLKLTPETHSNRMNLSQIPLLNEHILKNNRNDYVRYWRINIWSGWNMMIVQFRGSLNSFGSILFLLQIKAIFTVSVCVICPFGCLDLLGISPLKTQS